MHLTIRFLLTVSALCATGLASAGTLGSGTDISLRMTGFSDGHASVDTGLTSGYISAGRLHGLWTENGSSRSFLTYCPDIFQSVSWDTSYTYTLVGIGTANGFTSRKEDLMGKLYTLAGAAVNYADTSAAFELATWEIVNESANGLDLGSSAFRLERGGSTKQIQLANGWPVAVLAPGTPKIFNATRLYSSVAQDYVVFNCRPSNTASKLPEPGSLALSGVALVALLATRRRSRGLPAG